MQQVSHQSQAFSKSLETLLSQRAADSAFEPSTHAKLPLASGRAQDHFASTSHKHICHGPACCPPAKSVKSNATQKAAAEIVSNDALLKPPKKIKLRQYTPADVKQGPINRLGRTLIRELYWRVTRNPRSPLAKSAQGHFSKCACRILTPSPLSCSEYGYRAYEVLPGTWATTLTVMRNLACTPLTDCTPVGKLFDQPLPYKEFIQRAKKDLAGKPLVDIGDPKDWAFFAGGLTRDLLIAPVYLAGQLLGLVPKKPKHHITRIAYYEKKGPPPECEALLNLNMRRMYFNSIINRNFKEKAYASHKLNKWRIEPE